MKWSLKLGEIAGIGIFVHWTFLLLIGWVLFAHLADGEGVGLALEGVAFILALFGCIVLHELGHALTARQFGIRTRDITLLPIGGVARLERIPEKPMQEFLVAIAGPAVNIVIAVVLAVVVGLMAGLAGMTDVKLVGGGFLMKLLVVNVGLAVFNMIPAFPMDGGRVLRALLVPMMGHLRATDTAASVGHIIAIGFGILGLFTNPMLIFIALFIYLGAQQEAQMAHVNALLHGVPVRDAMMTNFRTLSASDSLETALHELRAGDQKDFPVVDDHRLVGMLRGKVLIDLSAQANPATPIADMMQRDCRVVPDSALLQEVFEQMHGDDCSTMPVVQNGRVVGLISLANVGEWLMIQSARKAGGFSSPSRPNGSGETTKSG